MKDSFRIDVARV